MLKITKNRTMTDTINFNNHAAAFTWWNSLPDRGELSGDLTNTQSKSLLALKHFNREDFYILTPEEVFEIFKKEHPVKEKE
jgi:hypothetical protein